jgi:flagellar basal body rod protein FlgB
MNYKTNTPNYKSKNVSNFRDFIDNLEDEKSELNHMNRDMISNSDTVQKYTKNSKFKYNRVTRKMDDLSKPEINDKLSDID